jgi:cytochrome P450
VSLPAWLTGIGAQRLLFSILRVVAPVLVMGKRAIISRHKDVVEVLKRDQDFTISQINGPKMARIQVPFFLGMDASPAFEREEGVMQRVARREDLDGISSFVGRQTDSLLKAARSVGRIDVVQDLARVVPARLIEHYFGVRADERILMSWMRILFWDIFFNLGNDPSVHEKALVAAEELKPFLLDYLSQRRKERSQGAPGNESLLDRLIDLGATPAFSWVDDDVIRRNLCGLMVGAVDTTNTAVVHAVDQLLDRPGRFEEAAKAAEAGDLSRVRQYAYEALRFNPQAPGLLRYCEKETRLNGSVIPAQTTLVLSTLSAMFDSSVFEHPEEFNPNRATEYLHFGNGLHQCFGRYINAVQIPAIIAGLLRLKNLRRAKGSDRDIIYDGPFPDRWILEFDP